MRKTLVSMMFLGLMAVLASCDRRDEGSKVEPLLSLNKTSITLLDPAETTIDVQLQANVDWVALINSDAAGWITISPDSGSASSEMQAISIAVKANETNTSRATRISFAARIGGKAVELDLVQSPTLSLLGRDSTILIELYEKTAGWKWKKSPWQPLEPISTWYGVKIGVVGGGLRVIGLDLDDQNVLGPLPENMQNLTELVTLKSAFNPHGGTLPEWLPKLTKLRYFYMADCDIVGKIPEGYWDMTELRQMDISSNEITGPLSIKVGRMVNLEELDLEGNAMGGELPKEVGDMAGLLAINIKGCKFTGEIPKELEKLSKCTHLHFDDNDFTGGIPEFDGPLSQSLTSMQISGCQKMTGPLPKAFGKFKNLWELIVSYTGTSGEFPTEYIDCPLEQVQAYDTKLSGQLPRWEKHPTLNAFIASGNNFTGTLPNWIASCDDVDLKDSDLSGNLPNKLIARESTNRTLLLSGNDKMGGEIPSQFWLNASRSELDIHNLGFSGTLPSDDEMSQFALNWKSIDIVGNKFSGEIPASLFILKNMQAALLAGNNFTGQMPSTPGLNDALQLFSVSGNRLTGEFPKIVKSHTNWSATMWNPDVNICPQQADYGFQGDSCVSSAE